MTAYRALGALVAVWAGLAFVAGPASAQMPTINMMPDVKTKSPEEKEREAVMDKAYRESLRKIPDTNTANDPWGAVRSVDSKVAKPAAPKAEPKAAQTKRAKDAATAN